MSYIIQEHKGGWETIEQLPDLQYLQWEEYQRKLIIKTRKTGISHRIIDGQGTEVFLFNRNDRGDVDVSASDAMMLLFGRTGREFVKYHSPCKDSLR